jgi:hypothetical protein
MGVFGRFKKFDLIPVVSIFGFVATGMVVALTMKSGNLIPILWRLPALKGQELTNMTLLGKQIQLQGISQKGKNRVREQGDRWTILAETNHVLFAPNEIGPWIFAAPAGQDQNHKASRWVRVTEDKDFKIVILES